MHSGHDIDVLEEYSLKENCIRKAVQNLGKSTALRYAKYVQQQTSVRLGMEASLIRILLLEIKFDINLTPLLKCAINTTDLRIVLAPYVSLPKTAKETKPCQKCFFRIRKTQAQADLNQTRSRSANEAAQQHSQNKIQQSASENARHREDIT